MIAIGNKFRKIVGVLTIAAVSTLTAVTIAAGNAAFAQGLAGGAWAIGFSGGVVSSSQNDMNDLIKRNNTGDDGPISTGQMTSAYELAPFMTYRFDSTIFAFQLRPSYFYQSEDGSGDEGSYEMAVTGWTVFPLLRLYPLENESMKFYMQFGLGYGRMMGEINEGAGNNVKFESGSFGTVVGMGAEFCFTVNHCINLEGDYRYLNFERSLVMKSSGTFEHLTSYDKGAEIEMDDRDLTVRMGGLMFMGGYTYWF